jgi:hypothetical protein
MNRKFFSGLAVVALVCAASSVGAQSYTISLNDVTTFTGGSFNIAATLDNSAGLDVQGWSYGVCNDAAAATPNQVNNEGTATVKNGAAADFNEKAIFPDGWTQGVVICFTGCAVLPAGTPTFVMASADYTAGTPGAYTFAFCSTLGTPNVATVVVVGGGSITPTQNSASVDVGDDPCGTLSFDYIAPAAGNFNYPAESGLGGLSLSVDFSIGDNYNPSVPCSPAVTQGFSMGCSNDPSLVTATAVNSLLPFAADFFESGLFANGWTIGVVYSFTGQNTLTFPAPAAVVSVDYAGVAGALATIEGATSSPLAWDSGLGTPPVSNVVVVGGGSIAANFSNGSLTFFGTTTLPFHGGDCNGDSITNIADIIWLLSQLFSGGPTSNCPIACDANGDGALDAADPIYIASYVFLGGPPPAGSAGCDTVPAQTPADCTVNTCAP